MVSAAAIGGYVLAGMTLLLAYIQWKKSSQLHEILAESVARNEAMQAQSLSLRAGLNEAEAAYEKRGKSSARLEKSLDDWKSRAEALERRIGDEQQSYELNFERERGQVERYKAEIKALLQQLVEADQDRKELRQTLESRRSLAVERNEKEFSQLRDRLAEVTEKYERLQQDARRMDAILRKIDPKETARIKRKNKQYSQLFIIMRGQKELAEELSKNWELALRQTATWIIKSQNPSTVIPERIAALVGSALEIIGGHLFDDNAPDLYQTPDGHPETEQDLDDLISRARSADGQLSPSLPDEGFILPLAAADDHGVNLT